jgi:hypothetical protein
MHVQSATLNGQPWNKAWIDHEHIMQGGALNFRMGHQPSQSFGVGEGQRAVSAIEAKPLVPVPVFTPSDKRIREPIKVGISTPYPVDAIYYTLDGSEPNENSPRYTEPITIAETLTLRATAFIEGIGWSFPTSADFYKLDLNRKITLAQRYSSNYHGGGDDALIDGIRGKENWRLGHWHGYQGKDFEAVVDLGKTQPIQYLGAGFVQDIRSWIWMPTEIVFAVSNDGINFREVIRMQPDIASDDYDIAMRDYGKKLNTEARYVRVQAKNYGQIPDWHLGAGGQAFIFIDEIIIEP